MIFKLRCFWTVSFVFFCPLWQEIRDFLIHITLNFPMHMFLNQIWAQLYWILDQFLKWRDFRHSIMQMLGFTCLLTRYWIMCNNLVHFSVQSSNFSCWFIQWMVDENELRVIHYTLGPLKPWDWWTAWLLKPVDVWQVFLKLNFLPWTVDVIPFCFPEICFSRQNWPHMWCCRM